MAILSYSVLLHIMLAQILAATTVIGNKKSCYWLIFHSNVSAIEFLFSELISLAEAGSLLHYLLFSIFQEEK